MRLPPLVERARAAEGDSVGAVSDAGGSLLHVLAAGRGVSRAAEIGTGAGVASAWIASALPAGVPLYTVDRDELRAAAAKTLFADDPDVHALTGDWRSALAANAPFDFIHIADDDARGAIDEVVSLAVPRATLVLDGDAGKWRVAWASHPRLDATVVDAGGTTRFVVAVVRG